LATDDLDLSVSKLALNPKGDVLAVAYGHEHHVAWCAHKSWLALWNLALPDRVDPERPSFRQEIEGCLTCIRFHPLISTIVVVTTVNGDILVWDTSLEAEGKDVLMANSRTAKESVSGDAFHYDRIVACHWISTSSMTANDLRLWQLLTLGVDGKVVLWDLDVKQRKVMHVKGVQLFQSDLASSAPRLPLSISAGDVVKDGNVKSAMVATQNGMLVTVPFSALSSINTKDKSLPVLSASVKLTPVQGHQAAVEGVQVHKDDAHLFLTWSLDGSVKVWDLRRFKEPTRVLFPCSTLDVRLVQAQWHPKHARHICVATSDGRVMLLKEGASRGEPLFEAKSLPVRGMSPAASRFCAVYHAKNTVELWRTGNVQ
jgi:WD40 repeat protein